MSRRSRRSGTARSPSHRYHVEPGRVGKNRQLEFVKDGDGVDKGVRKLLEIAEEYGAKVTCAVCPESVVYFPKDAKCEVGLHVHPGWQKFSRGNLTWYAGDAWLRTNCQQSSDSSVLKDYSFYEQFHMIRQGQHYLARTIGVPTCFVAGRWCVNNDTYKALVRNMLLRDCSAVPHTQRPHYDWSKLPRICMPYHGSENDYQVRGDLPVLTIPIAQTVFNTNVNPEGADLSWMMLAFTEYLVRRVPLFHICLHAPSMTSRYYVDRMHAFLSFISKHKSTRFKYVSEITALEDCDNSRRVATPV